MMRVIPLRYQSVVAAVVLAASLTPAPGGARAQATDCADYRHHIHWLPGPVNLTTSPAAIARWQDRLLILHPTALVMVGTNDRQAPVELGRINGVYSDVAIGSDFLVLGHTGGFRVYDLPSLTLRCSHVGGWAEAPRLACSDDLIVAAAEGRFYFLDGPADGAVTPLGEWAIPSYRSPIGAGKLLLIGPNLVRCSGGGNNIYGYYTDLSLIDVTDPQAPVLTDQLAAAPGDGPGSITVFRDIQPLDDGFVLWWVTNQANTRPDMYDYNEVYLSRVSLENGRFAWRGHVSSSGPYYGGFAISGSEAIWTIGDIGGNADQPGFVVDLDPDLPVPVVSRTLPAFAAGPVGWLPGSGLIASGRHFYHLEGEASSPSVKEAAVGGATYGAIEIDTNFILVWTNTADWGGGHWAIRVYDRRHSPATVVATLSDGVEWGSVGPISLINRRVHYALDVRDRTVEIDENGHFTEPAASNEPRILDAIPWGPYSVVATPDSLLICRDDGLLRLRRVASLGGITASGISRLVRAGEVLFGLRVNGNSGYLLRYDLSDPTMPAYQSASSGWGPYLRYQAEAGLVFECGFGRLRWHRLDGDGSLTLLGSMPQVADLDVRDAWLDNGILYVALGGYGLGVYEFDPVTGPAPFGGWMSFDGAVQIIPNGNRFQVAPGLITMPLACATPLPVMASSLRAVRQDAVVVIEWHCSLDGAGGEEFVLRRRSNGGGTEVLRRVATRGDYRTVDPGAPRGDAVTYELWLEAQDTAPLLVDSVSLDEVHRAPPEVSVSAAPNPANPSTLISFEIARASRVTLGIYALDGRLVVNLVDRELEGGRHVAGWDGRDASGRQMASGTYLMRLAFDGLVRSGRLTLVR